MNKKLSRLFTLNFTVISVTLALFCLITWALGHSKAALIQLGLSVLLLIYYLLWNTRRKRAFVRYLQDVNFSVDSVSSQQMRIPVPAVILNRQDLEIVWSNDAFSALVGTEEDLFEVPLGKLFSDFSAEWLTEGRACAPVPVACGDRRCIVYGNLIRPQKNSDAMAAMLYFVDVSDLLNIKEEYELSRPVVSIILVDNYDELTSNQPDKSISNFSAQLDDAITAWASGSTGILRKLERNRYLFLFEERELAGFIDEKFSILDAVHEITNDLGSPATLSIGIGREGESFQENYDFASLGIDMSLSRGGDQAVIKDRYNFSFYGGRAKEAERRTKVKSRVMAGSFQELISQSSNVLIMGHKNADIDAVGAAVGVNAICRKLGCRSRIVIDLSFNAAGNLLRQLQAAPEYAPVLISPQEALDELGDDTLLVIVDTNRPGQVESSALLSFAGRVAVIDHHRRAADYIENALFNFHEPYASSACELVTELVQYLMDREDILPVETMALLAGMVLDTKNFSVRTGARTFEAAAWLRKNGADTVAVKRLFQNDLSATLNRYEVLRHAELYRDNIALCCLDYTADRITAAQASDELLNISGIETSFVFYPDGNRVICSARSIGEANVQMILEPLGGGGNQATAGAQISGKTPEEVKEAIKASIDDFFSE